MPAWSGEGRPLLLHYVEDGDAAYSGLGPDRVVRNGGAGPLRLVVLTVGPADPAAGTPAAGPPP